MVRVTGEKLLILFQGLLGDHYLRGRLRPWLERVDRWWSLGVIENPAFHEGQPGGVLGK